MNREVTDWRQTTAPLLALAALLVFGNQLEIGFHSGFLGIDVAIILCGFLVARNELKFEDAFKPLAVMLLLVLSGFFLFGPFDQQRNAAMQAIASIGLFSNWKYFERAGGFFHPVNGSQLLLHTWVVSLLVQLAAAYFVLRKVMAQHLRRAALVLAVASFSVTSLFLIQHRSGFLVFDAHSESFLGDIVARSSEFVFFAPMSRGWQFFAGVWLGATDLRRFSVRTSRFFVIGALIAIFLSGLLSNTAHDLFLSRDRLVVSGSTLIALTFLPSSRFGKSWCGQITNFFSKQLYVAYLFLAPSLFSAQMVFGYSTGAKFAGVAGCLVATWATRWLLRFARDRKIDGKLIGVLGVFGAIVLVAVYTGSAKPLAAIVFDRKPLPEAIASWEVAQLPCIFSTSSAGDLYECVEQDGLDEAVLVGDSHAMALQPGFSSAADTMDAKWSVLAKPGCTFALFKSAPQNVECEQWVKSVINRINATKVEVVFVYQCPRLRAGCPQGDLFPQYEEEFVFGVVAAINQIRDSDTKVVLLGDTPVVGIDQVSESLLMGNQFSRVAIAPFFQKQLESISEKYLNEIVKPKFVDGYVVMASELCELTSCRYRNSLGQPLWFDGDHLSQAGSLQFESILRRELDEQLGGK